MRNRLRDNNPPRKRFATVPHVNTPAVPASNLSVPPDSLTVTYGTHDTGVVGDLAAVGGTDVMVSELTGANCLEVALGFTGVEQANRLAIYGYYSGSSSHVVAVEICDITVSPAVWERLGVLPDATVKTWYSFGLFDADRYNNAGAVLVRFRHVSNGIPSHDLILDYVALVYSSEAIDEGGGLELGETAATAYRGDRGKTAYDHSQAAHAPANAEQNVQADWTQADTGADDYIKNKPTIPAAQVQSDWNAVAGMGVILNKPSIPVVSDTAYDASSWDGNTDAPSKNAVRDKIESMGTGTTPTAWGKYF